MDWIYTHATRTFVWLGEENKATHDAFELLRDLYKVISKYKQQYDYLVRRPTIEDLYDHGMPTSEDNRWLTLDALLHNEWFSRTWVLQEVALAKDPWLLNGKHLFSWHEFEEIAHVLTDSGASHHLMLPVGRAYSVAQIHFQCLRPEGVSLLNLLAMSTSTTTTKPKDKVFALLGIASDKNELRQILDYGDHISATLTKVALFYLRAGCLDVLNFSADPSLRSFQRIPTWVPDWSHNGPAMDMLALMYRVAGLSTFTPRVPRKLPRVLSNRGTLVLSGTFIDRVKDFGKHISPLHQNLYSMDGRSAGTRLEQWRNIANSSYAYGTTKNIQEAFARTIVVGEVSGVGQCEQFSDLYSNWIKQLFKQPRHSDQAANEARIKVQRYARRAQMTCLKRSFFTIEGGYMGLGPYFLRPGDLVAHLDGGSTFYVVRKAEKSCYTIVGDAYIHGVDATSLSDVEFEEIALI